jgi:hypothetical protein
MHEEVNEKTVALCVRTAKMTGSVLMKAISKYLQASKQKQMVKQQKKTAKRNEIPQGKVTVKELARQNAGMVNIEITPKNIKSFEKYARKYGVNYALKKDKSKDPPVYMVFFKARDKGAINAAFREFSQSSIKKANKPSIRKKLAAFRDVAAKLKKDKTRTKHQEQSL